MCRLKDVLSLVILTHVISLFHFTDSIFYIVFNTLLIAFNSSLDSVLPYQKFV